MAKQSYTGTLVFCIIASVVSIAIVTMYFFINLEPVKYLLLTILICLVAIIVSAIVAVVLYEKKIAKEESIASDQPIQGISCPDYFTKRYDDTDRKYYCESAYKLSKDTVLKVGEQFSKIDIDALIKKKAAEVCNDYKGMYKGKIPWPELESTCESIIAS